MKKDLFTILCDRSHYDSMTTIVKGERNNRPRCNFPVIIQVGGHAGILELEHLTAKICRLLNSEAAGDQPEVQATKE